MKPAFQMERDMVWTAGAPAARTRAAANATAMAATAAAARAGAAARSTTPVPGIAPRVAGAMSKQVIAADPMFTVGRALALAERHGVSHLPVAWSDGEILGMVCLCDLWAADDDELVTRVMSLPVVTVFAREPLGRAADLMRAHDVGCLPVIDVQDRMIGIITQGDLVRARALSAEDLPPACQACGSRHHVRTGVPVRTARSSSTFCVRCLHAATNAVDEVLGTV